MHTYPHLFHRITVRWVMAQEALWKAQTPSLMGGFLFLLASCLLSLSSPEACLPAKLLRGWNHCWRYVEAGGLEEGEPTGRKLPHLPSQQEATDPRRELLLSSPQAHPPSSPLLDVPRGAGFFMDGALLSRLCRVCLPWFWTDLVFAAATP